MIRDALSVLDRLGRTLAHRAGVAVEVGGDQAYTNGKVIHLPALPVTLTEREWRVAGGLLNHEAGHVLHTSFGALPSEPLLAQILNTLEDPRIEHLFCQRYPGASADIRLAHETALAELSQRASTLEPYQQRLLALLCLIDGLPAPACLGQDALAWAAMWEHIRPQVLNAPTTEDLLPLAQQIHGELFTRSATAPVPAAGQEPQAGPQPSPGDVQAPGGEGIPVPTAPVGSESLLSQTMKQLVGALAKQPGYRPGAIHGPHLLPQGDGRRLIELARRTVPGLVRRLSHAVQAQCQSRWLPDQERGRLDPRRLHRLIGGQGRRLFRRLEVGQQVDTAATLIIDCSSSMSGSETTAAAATTVVAQSLDRVGVSTEVLAFSGRALYLAKRFAEPVSVLADRLAALSARGGTPLGEILLAAVKRLVHEPVERHVVFVATDGQPDSVEYCADILRRCERVGVEAIGVGIHTDISRLFKRSITIETIDQLAPALLGQVRSVLLTSHHHHPRRAKCR